MPVSAVRLRRSRDAAGGVMVRLGVPLLDEYLEFLAGRCRPNTVLAVAYDLKVFFTVVPKPPRRVRPVDVLGFMTAQRTGGDGRLQVAGAGAGGVSARTLRRRLSSVSGLYGFLHARGDVMVNPVPRGLPTRRERQRPGQGVPLVRVPRTLPQVLGPAEIDALTAALLTHRDRAMIAAMVLGGLRRCEVLGLRLGDLRFGERRVFIAEGKGGHQRLVPVSARFFAASAPISMMSVRLVRAPTGCSWCSRVRVAACRCLLTGWMRYSTAPAAGPGCPMGPATSCGIPA